MAGLGRRPGRHPLRAARSDQRQQLQQAGGRLALQDRQPRTPSRLQPAGEAVDGERPPLLHRRLAPRRGRGQCGDRRAAVDASPRGRPARRQLRRAGCRAAASATGPTARATSASSTSRSAISWSASTRRPDCRCATSASTASSISRRTTISSSISIESDIGWNGAPVVARNVVIVGAAHRAGTAPRSKSNAKGYIRGYDARTGKRLWIFHTIPTPGEFGNDTWLNDSWSYTGHTGVWTQLTVDEELGIAYLPVEIPTGDYFGGHRPGNNLFAESLVALNLETGKRLWHFQFVHHPIWDYDVPVRADPRGHHRRRKTDQGDRPADQAGLRLRVRSGHRAAGLADRRAAGRKGERADRVVRADAAIPDQAAALRAPGLPRKRRHRFHAGAEGRGDEDRLPVQDRSAVHPADRARRGRQDRHALRAERGQLAWRLARSRNQHPLPVFALADQGPVDGERPQAVGDELHQRRRREGR